MAKARNTISKQKSVDFFLNHIGTSQVGWTPDTVHAKFDWMYHRIQIPEARDLATPLYELALHKLNKKEEEMIQSQEKGKA
jgi:hypothetical protein